MTSRRNQRGTGLLEPLIAIVILSFGLLGLARFQLGMLARTTDAQARAGATLVAEELLAFVRTDVSKRACYVGKVTPIEDLTPVLSCSDAARQALTDWAVNAKKLPGFTEAKSELLNTGQQMKVTLVWTSKAFKDERRYEVTTDVRE